MKCVSNILQDLRSFCIRPLNALFGTSRKEGDPAILKTALDKMNTRLEESNNNIKLNKKKIAEISIPSKRINEKKKLIVSMHYRKRQSFMRDKLEKIQEKMNRFFNKAINI